eukprot:TRINITY_DN76536_c0_g1_i1.p1 TRINITY_DN76536_c0_g1~~TRINITY_DN76536_c0_g1_i1.p1  ORF type:complete len:156 (-),score=58.26 TRINITY_DN76536_c0_g1_i1:245-652(-)
MAQVKNSFAAFVDSDSGEEEEETGSEQQDVEETAEEEFQAPPAEPEPAMESVDTKKKGKKKDVKKAETEQAAIAPEISQCQGEEDVAEEAASESPVEKKKKKKSEAKETSKKAPPLGANKFAMLLGDDSDESDED